MLSAESVDYIINTFGLGDKQEEIENATLYQVVYDLGVWAAEKYVNENGYPDSEDFRNMANAYWKYLNGGMEDYVLTDEDYKQVYKTFLQAKDFSPTKTTYIMRADLPSTNTALPAIR